MHTNTAKHLSHLASVRNALTGARGRNSTVPDGPRTSWSSDFDVAVPESRDHNGTTFTNIMTAADRFTKRKHFILTRTITTVDAAYAMLHIIRSHGLPKEMVTDRGTQWDSGFFRELSKLLSI